MIIWNLLLLSFKYHLVLELKLRVNELGQATTFESL